MTSLARLPFILSSPPRPLILSGWADPLRVSPRLVPLQTPPSHLMLAASATPAVSTTAMAIATDSLTTNFIETSLRLSCASPPS